jgi:hypothetical protein
MDRAARVNFYSQQFACLTIALRHVGRTDDAATQFFHHYHGYKDHAKAWSLFSDTELSEIAIALFVTRRTSSPWRRLMCATLDELNRRQLLPSTAEDLSIAWDICIASDKIDPTAPPSFLEVWLCARPLLAHHRTTAT